MKIIPINGTKTMGHQLEGDVSQRRISKYLPVDGNDIVEKVKSVRKMREAMIIEATMKRWP